ncbi:13E12 repeat family protein [Mycobacterium lepraemurium]|nr:13E12 repeat family protein [Mycobacterium lepraemurium]
MTAEVAAQLRIGQGLAAAKVRYARAMRERLPRVGEVFRAGEIDFRLFATIVYRTDLITDRQVLAAVDAELAATAARWPSMTRGRLAARVDAVVAKADADAVRRAEKHPATRHVWIAEMGEGLSHLEGTVSSPDAHALDKRLDALAATVCERDPRTGEQRRADALGALAAGADRLGCRCGRADCAAGKRPAAGPVVIHVIAELAASARLMPLVHPADAPPENRYTPSAALADFVRCRDLTCRWPGCDRPATECDLDHTIPYAEGGSTHASNLKCYCRTHHVVKTFWGWREQQLPDATLILTSPAGQTYVTTPGSALLFPSLCVPTGEPPGRSGPDPSLAVSAPR